MWFLKEEPTRAKQYTPTLYWFGGIAATARTIGRKNVDIRLNASSVSRTHATIRVQSSSFARASKGTIPTVEDSSAYGTFLKYPVGHPANRSSQQDGHHDRLDKEIPVEVHEGALLAFGAPSAWWRVGWHPMLIYPMSLDSRQTTRLEDVVKQTGMAIAQGTGSNLSDVTHVVIPLCRASSSRFLRSIVEGKYIVTPAWTDAVANMVNNACKTASTAANVETAVAATTIPSEDNFTPSFSDEDVAAFDQAVLTKAFDPTLNRGALFRGITFVFADDDRLSHWNMVLEACGARAFLESNSVAAPNKRVRVRSLLAGSEDGLRSDLAPSCAESDIICAILSADAESIRKVSRGIATPVVPTAPIADVATPAPSDSDAETADNEPVEADTVHSRSVENRRKRPRCEVEPDANSEHDRASIANTRRGATVFKTGGEVIARADVPRGDTVEESGEPEPHSAGKVGDEDLHMENEVVNPRAYFSVGEPGMPPARSNGSGAEGNLRADAADVRPFKRRKFPAARRRIGMVKVRAADEAEGLTPAAFVKKSTSEKCQKAFVDESLDDDDDDV